MFNVGDRVLMLLPIPGEPLEAIFCGPYTTDKKVMQTTLYVHQIGGKIRGCVM